MAQTLMQRIVEALPFLDDIGEAVQPEVQKAVNAGGTTARNVLDGVWLEAPLHPVMTDVPIGSWTAALVFDGLDLATGKKPVRHAADLSLVFGTLGALGAAVTGLSDWRYLSGGSRRMGVAHGLLSRRKVETVEDERGGPGSDRHVRHHGMQRRLEPDAVEHVAHRRAAGVDGLLHLGLYGLTDLLQKGQCL